MQKPVWTLRGSFVLGTGWTQGLQKNYKEESSAPPQLGQVSPLTPGEGKLTPTSTPLTWRSVRHQQGHLLQEHHQTCCPMRSKHGPNLRCSCGIWERGSTQICWCWENPVSTHMLRGSQARDTYNQVLCRSKANTGPCWTRRVHPGPTAVHHQDKTIILTSLWSIIILLGDAGYILILSGIIGCQLMWDLTRQILLKLWRI